MFSAALMFFSLAGFDAPQTGGARALGCPAGIAFSAPADLIALDPQHPSLVGRRSDPVLDSWIFAAHSCIDSVWRAGVRLVSGGQHHAREPIAARYRQTLERLLRA